MELIHGSETSANYTLTPGKYPKEHIQYSNHGESLKSRISTRKFSAWKKKKKKLLAILRTRLKMDRF
jgi:hypothetical protein